MGRISPGTAEALDGQERPKHRIWMDHVAHFVSDDIMALPAVKLHTAMIYLPSTVRKQHVTVSVHGVGLVYRTWFRKEVVVTDVVCEDVDGLCACAKKGLVNGSSLVLGRGDKLLASFAVLLTKEQHRCPDQSQSSACELWTRRLRSRHGV